MALETTNIRFNFFDQEITLEFRGGSEKQIQWAKDILQKDYENWVKTAVEVETDEAYRQEAIDDYLKDLDGKSLRTESLIQCRNFEGLRITDLIRKEKMNHIA